MNFRMSLKKTIVFLMIIAGLTELCAQIVITSTGGTANGSGGSISYSVGQVVYTTNTGTSGSVAQGVQQPFEISTLTGFNEANDISLICSAYPNPTIDVIQLIVDTSFSKSTQSIHYQLLDMQGKIIETKKLDAQLTNIVVSSLNPAIYFLRVIHGNKDLKTYKIIKN